MDVVSLILYGCTIVWLYDRYRYYRYVIKMVHQKLSVLNKMLKYWYCILK
jgi:hypothetical protein